MMDYYWDFATDSEPVVVFAFWLGVVVFAMTIIMLGVILIMRQVMLRRERKHRRAMQRWKHILANTDVNTTVPRLPQDELSGFLEVWNATHEPLHGETTPALTHIAQAVDLKNKLYALLDKGNFHEKIAVLIALGHIKDRGSFDLIAGYLNDDSPLISLCAARALTQADPQRAVTLLVPQIVERIDWAPARVATILQEAGTEYASKELSKAIIQAHADVLPRLIRFLSGVSPHEAAPIIRQILSSAHDERMISTCLQVVNDPVDLPLIRTLTQHTRWHVRMQAAVALGRLGVEGDELILLALLGDAQWWVRYRAAQGLLSLAFMDKPRLMRMLGEQTDHYAKDILNHVMAEKNLAEAAR